MPCDTIAARVKLRGRLGASTGPHGETKVTTPQLVHFAADTAIEPLMAALRRDGAVIVDDVIAPADLAALKTRINTVLNNLLNAELQTGEGPKTALLRKLIAEAGKSDAELKREALAAEIAAKQAELNKLQP